MQCLEEKLMTELYLLADLTDSVKLATSAPFLCIPWRKSSNYLLRMCRSEDFFSWNKIRIASALLGNAMCIRCPSLDNELLPGVTNVIIKKHDYLRDSLSVFARNLR